MSETNQQNPSTAKAPETPNKLGKLFPSLSKAWEVVRNSANKDKGLFAKISLFFSTFWEEMHTVEKQQKQVSEQTKKDVEKGVDDTMRDAKTATGLKDNVEKSDQEFYDEILATAVASNEDFDREHQTNARTALAKMDKAVKDQGVETLTFDEAGSLTAVGLLTFSKLKAKYPNRDDFKKALDRLDNVSDNSNYPLKKLLSTKVLQIFKMDVDLSNAGDAMKFLEGFGVGLSDALKVKGVLANLKDNPIKDENEVVATMKKYFLPNTSDGAIQTVVRTVNKMIVNKADRLDTETLTTLVFSVAESDMQRLIDILGGKRNSSLGKVA